MKFNFLSSPISYSKIYIIEQWYLLFEKIIMIKKITLLISIVSILAKGYTLSLMSEHNLHLS